MYEEIEMVNNIKNYIVKCKTKGNSCEEEYYENYTEWKSAYRKNHGCYKDPDAISCLFYKDLAKFLNKQEKEIDGLIGKFAYEFSLDPFGICVKYEENEENNKWFLKSDQLGFSAGGIYEKYIEKAIDKENAEENAIKWIFDSRTLGGSFLWPMDINKNDDSWITNPQYNKVRGRGRIQDRADMTLLDIKNCFNNIQYNGKISYLRKQYNEKPHMKKWLDHFGTKEDGFDRYINFFMFEPFMNMESMYPKDLTNMTNDEKTISKFWGINEDFKKYTAEQLEIVLCNTSEWIVNRSENMVILLEKNI